jgi:tRNA G10  N-methylase Trm11
MQIGMMPAKLTHQLISIGVYTHQQNHTTDTQPTIRDPFVGFGTTSIVTNAYSYNTIGSDINISQAKQNITRRSDHALSTDAKITLRKHDMTTPLTDPVYEYADIIVSE